MPRIKFHRLSAWDLFYAVSIAVASVLTYCLLAFAVPAVTHRPWDSVGILWAVISTVFVFRDTRAHSLAAGVSRLVATGISFALCLLYLLLFPANGFGLALLIIIGCLLMMVLGRRDEIGLTAITTAVVMIVGASRPQDAWQQPIHRLIDTVLGVAIGMACKWVASFLFFRVTGEAAR
jgi:uncharacterized membrane protein YgaE (UPF0421/DUF939 family)